jgi:hypothetical protein
MKSQNRHSSALTVFAGRAGVLVSLVSAGVVGLALAFGQFAVSADASPAWITPRAYEGVKEGMTRQDVQEAIGLPAGDYRDDAHKPGGRSYTEWSEQAAEAEFGSGDTAGRQAWEGNAYSIVVGFDDAGAVSWKTLWRHVPPTPPREKGRTAR